MDLQAYLGPLRKWWWLMVVASLVAASASFLVTRQQPPVYMARATLVIGRSVFVPNPTGTDFWLGQQLATFYADYARREPVRNATMAALGLEWLPDYQAHSVPNSQLIEIVVTDTSPERAQAVANELANQLVNQSPTSRESGALDHQAFVQQQLFNIETEINQTMEEMATKQHELGELFSARQIAETEADLVALETKLTTLQTNYAALLANTREGASNTLSVIEYASLPRGRIGPNTRMMVLLTTVIGLLLAAGAAYLIEFLDDTLKSPEDVTRLIDWPMIGLIAEVKREESYGVYVAKQPRSVVADAYRSLRTNLEFAAVDKPLKTIFVSSAGISEGKTSVAINLAVVMAQGGKRVVLIDADLRRPNVYRNLGLSNNQGLSDVFRGHINALEAFTPWNIDNVRVLLSGNPPPNPADLLGSKKMDAILEALKQDSDIIIVDGPPFLVADASILANKVDGVILVVRHGITRREGLKVAQERLNQAGANVLGVVLNRVPSSGYRVYGHYGYEAYYKAGEGTEAVKKPVHGRRVTISQRFSRFSEAVRVGLRRFRIGRRESPVKAVDEKLSFTGNGSKPVTLEEKETVGLAVEPLAPPENAAESPGSEGGAPEPITEPTTPANGSVYEDRELSAVPAAELDEPGPLASEPDDEAQEMGIMGASEPSELTIPANNEPEYEDQGLSGVPAAEVLEDSMDETAPIDFSPVGIDQGKEDPTLEDELPVEELETATEEEPT